MPLEEDYEPVDDKTAVAYRLWKRHPRFSSWSDATTQGVLDILEEIVLLTQAIRAKARSRLAGQGILLVNGRFIPIPGEPGPDEDPDEDPFMRDLIDNFTAPITNEGAASAVVPHVIRVDVDEKSTLD